jgi:UDP-N-acetyl-D-mannosaminuronic acid dehydrogenase
MENSMKTENEKYDVCVIGGLGHVGLPFGLALANAGKTVILNDINKESIRIVKSGRMPFKEEGADILLPKVLNKTLFVSSDKEVISKSHYVVVIIGTPVDEYLNPKYKLLFDFLDGTIDYIKNGQHVLLRSTIFPGTTEGVRRYFENAGKKVNISFCPERVVEGNALEELSKFPQIISAFDEKSFQEAEDLFKLLTNEVIKIKPIEAELAKIFTNTWRYIQFAIANQLYEISTQNDVDFYKVYEAITYKYPRCANLPMAGFAAGPCLFKDTMQLAAYSNNSFFLGHAAMLINEGLPNFIIQMLKSK